MSQFSRAARAFAACALALCAGLAAAPAAAQNPPAPVLNAKAWYLLDMTSGQVLASQGPAERVEPASLTKLMTAYLTFAAIKAKTISLEQPVPVSVRAWKAVGSRMFIEPKRPVTVAEAMRGMIIQSGNDASIALAELIAGSEDQFAAQMNREAQRMGMKNTHFQNATGLPDPQHYTTVEDLARLASALIRDYPDFYPLYSTKEYTYNKITQPNRNRLLWLDPNVDGMKTGHTDSAGFCLIASARRGPRRLLSVVVGTQTESARSTESEKLLNYGFLGYDDVRLYEKGQNISALEVWKGESREVKAGFDRELYVTVPKGEASKLKATLNTQKPLLAPISLGQKIGSMKVTLEGRDIAEVPVVALDRVDSAGFFGRTLDTMRLWFAKK
ncbi:MAG TPA: D-alanyl-D-alanine carboxypeptidase family protein [Burkholderiales bacterium]|jgi:D-alanyl-D-alanine carboxypeptidase (penicillin-binding protein 5/6)|nr:D-alanyl-D-alanine carboxypeptidase family protein [Burkholderiales bacterium]